MARDEPYDLKMPMDWAFMEITIMAARKLAGRQFTAQRNVAEWIFAWPMRRPVRDDKHRLTPHPA